MLKTSSVQFIGVIFIIFIAHYSVAIGAVTMKLDAQSKVLIDAMNSLNLPPLETIPVEVVRAGKSPYGYESAASIKNVENIVISGPTGEIPLRIYTPQGRGPFPVLVTFHGGGWVFGSLENHDGICRELCSQAACIVVSVDYHRAPEYKFPIPVIDCYTATEWAVKNIALYGGNPRKVAIGGDSAGGNLTAAVALMAKDKQSFSLIAQVLIYPVINYDFTTESYRIYQSGYLLTTAQMQWFWGMYTKNEADAINPYASPLRALSCKDLPQALVIVAEFDPLRDDSLAYAQKLLQAGVSVKKITYPTIHGFISFADRLDVGKKATEEIAQYLRTVFA